MSDIYILYYIILYYIIFILYIYILCVYIYNNKYDPFHSTHQTLFELREFHPQVCFHVGLATSGLGRCPSLQRSVGGAAQAPLPPGRQVATKMAVLDRKNDDSPADLGFLQLNFQAFQFPLKPGLFPSFFFAQG